MTNKLEWWGYLHENGSIQTKRYFGEQDVIEAQESDFCEKVILPFEAENREQAILTIVEKLGITGVTND